MFNKPDEFRQNPHNQTYNNQATNTVHTIFRLSFNATLWFDATASGPIIRPTQ